MSILRKIWCGDLETRRKVLVASALLVAIGVAIIVVGVVADFGWSRLPGALLISLGGASGGAAVGFSPAARERFWSRLSGWRVRIAAAVAFVVAAPAIVAMASAVVGPLFGGGDARDTALVVLGVIIGLIMLVGTFLAGVIAVQATYERVTSAADVDGQVEEPS